MRDGHRRRRAVAAAVGGYVITTDVLRSVYYQAVARQTFDVYFFSRTKQS